MLASGAASAADVPGLNLRRLELPTDEAGGLYTEPAKAPGPLNWNAALVASYANRLVVLQDGSGAQVAVPVRHNTRSTTCSASSGRSPSRSACRCERGLPAG